jgi:hypothetical protein
LFVAFRRHTGKGSKKVFEFKHERRSLEMLATCKKAVQRQVEARESLITARAAREWYDN